MEDHSLQLPAARDGEEKIYDNFIQSHTCSLEAFNFNLGTFSCSLKLRRTF